MNQTKDLYISVLRMNVNNNHIK